LGKNVNKNYKKLYLSRRVDWQKYHNINNIGNLDYFYDSNVKKHSASLDYFADTGCVSGWVCDPTLSPLWQTIVTI
jgi:hypothetical protein